MSLFDRILAKIDGEAALIDWVARIVPWLAPLSPASFMYHNLIRIQLGSLEALAIAVVVEGFGVTVFYTWKQLESYNQTKRQNDPEASTIGIKSSILFYVTVVLLVNVVLDLERPPEVIVSRALLSLISIPASYLLSVRTQHAHRVTEIAEKKAEVKTILENGKLRKQIEELKEKIAGIISGHKAAMKEMEERYRQSEAVKAEPAKEKIAPAPKGKPGRGRTSRVSLMNDEEKQFVLKSSSREVEERFSVSDRTVRNMRTEITGGNKNGRH